jgi:hypothetical protein
VTLREAVTAPAALNDTALRPVEIDSVKSAKPATPVERSCEAVGLGLTESPTMSLTDPAVAAAMGAAVKAAGRRAMLMP